MGRTLSTKPRENTQNTQEQVLEQDRGPEGEPSSDPSVKELDELAYPHSVRFRYPRERDDSDKEIEYLSRALALTPGGHPDRPHRLGRLCKAYIQRYRNLGEIKDLEEAINYGSRALESTANDHSALPHLLADLGRAYADRFRQSDKTEDLQVSIGHFSRALTLIPDDHPNFPSYLIGIGVSYNDRFQRLKELVDFEKALEYFQRALVAAPENHPSFPCAHACLGMCHGQRFQRLGKLEDLERTIDHFSRAVALTRVGHEDLPRWLIGLGTAYSDRFYSLGQIEDLEKAIEHKRHAVNITSEDHWEYPYWLSSLGLAYRDRFQRLGSLEDLEKAVECFARAVALTPDGHVELPPRLARLGESYDDRFQRLGEIENLDQAIELKTRAVSLTPDDHPALIPRLGSLGVSCGNRFRLLGVDKDLANAIEYLSRALSMTPGDDPGHSSLLNNIGALYGVRFGETGVREDLEKSIEYKSHALALIPEEHISLPGQLDSLGEAYGDRFQSFGEAEDLEKAMACYSRALALTPEGHPRLPLLQFHWARSCFHQYQLTNEPSHLNNSLKFFRKASQLSIQAPRMSFRIALRWAHLASKHSDLNCMEAFQVTIDLLPHFIWLGSTTSQRYEDLVMVENLAIDAANAAIISSNYSLALEWLEHARCVVWNQSLMLRSPLDELYSIHPELANDIRDISKQLYSAGSEVRAFQTLSSDLVISLQSDQQRRRLAAEFEYLIKQARYISGFQDFFRPTKAKSLVHVARNGPIVMINCHKDHCDALLILPGHEDLRHLPLPNFSHEKAQRARSELEKSLRSKKLRERGVRILHEPGHQARIESVLAVLWSEIVRPILDFLGYTNDAPPRNLPHITWCPTGALSFLPLHAAGDYDQPQSKVFDYAISSYTPTLTALLSPTPNSLGPDCRVLAIGQAATPGRNPLPGTVKELAHLKIHTQNKFNYSQLVNDQATTTAVLDAMEQHDWVHLACHAHQNVSDPTKSGFYLHDGTLDLASINRRSFKNKGLAFLSACQTATGDERLPDEAVHLASGMLMAGYPSVIATMWSVVDDDAPFVADKVYALLMKDGEIGNGKTGRALHHAIAALRNKVGEKEFARWAPYIHIGS
ncbi:unnamed protein product [Rhizoctonia solani]|uniref:CHAT domain-containing protein n=1 Tax=Rhizoctonia solani TaxID=456999 RepID=A0A8H3DSL4_9AGAM|nr:unnamed protein product [Rhizoctonia solani]